MNWLLGFTAEKEKSISMMSENLRPYLKIAKFFKWMVASFLLPLFLYH